MSVTIKSGLNKKFKCRQARPRDQAEISTLAAHGRLVVAFYFIKQAYGWVVHRICARRWYWSVLWFLVSPCRIANNVDGMGPSQANLRI
jgi:hypothetical protein